MPAIKWAQLTNFVALLHSFSRVMKNRWKSIIPTLTQPFEFKFLLGLRRQCFSFSAGMMSCALQYVWVGSFDCYEIQSMI